MDDSTLPPPHTCLHNLHREPFGSGRTKPEPTDLCLSPLGMIHMLDCPLTLGRACTYYEAAAEEREALDDDEVVRHRALLHADYMRWSYRRRVHALREPVGYLPAAKAIEFVPEPEVEPGADLVFTRAEAEAKPEPEAELAVVGVPAETPEERYPGQRRSEDRRVRPARGAHDHGGAEPATHCCDDEPERDEFPEVRSAPELPKTIDELFEALPEAILPDKPAERERRPRRRRSRSGPVGDGSGRPGGTPPAGGRSESADRGAGSTSGRSPRRRRGPRRPADAGAPRPPSGQPSEGQPDNPSGEGGGNRRRRRRRRPPRPGGSSAAPAQGS